MKLTVIILGALLATVFAKPAAEKRETTHFHDRALIKKALSLLEGIERRDEEGSGSGSGHFGSGSGSAMMNYGSGSGKRDFIKKSNTTSKRGIECEAENFQCADGLQCIYLGNVCEDEDYNFYEYFGEYFEDYQGYDNPADCVDGSDEGEACETLCDTLPGRSWCPELDPSYSGNFPPKNCMSNHYHRCDGIQACLDGSDEADCDEWNKIPKGDHYHLEMEQYVANKNWGESEKRSSGNESGSGKKHISRIAAEKRELKEKVQHLLEELKED